MLPVKKKSTKETHKLQPCFTPQRNPGRTTGKKKRIERKKKNQLIFKHCFHMPKASEDKCVCMSHFCNLALKAVAIWVLLHHAVCSQLTHMLNMLKKKKLQHVKTTLFSEDTPHFLQRAYSQGIIRVSHPAWQE